MRLASGFALFLCGTCALGATQDPIAAIRQTGQKLEVWLQRSDLSDRFEFSKLRRVRRPDAREGDDKWLQWELRFRTEGTRPDEENERFLSFVREYEAALGRTLVERLFFELLHESGERRTDVAVYLFVLETTYSISFDPAKGELVFRQDADRMLRRSIDLAGVGLAEGARAGAALLEQPVANLADRVQKFLTGYFAGPPPTSVSPALPEPDYAGVTVEGIKGRVLRDGRYWEKLHVSVDLKQAGEGTRAVCHVTGKYGGGLGNRLPSDYHDMDEEFRAELERFTDAMLVAMRNYLTPGG